jgi:exopolysaccharide biosynthesis polyprenyl glycosylphosphotransferase
MFRRFSVNFALLSIGIDLLVIGSSLAIVTYTRPALSQLTFVKEMTDRSSIPWILYVVFPVIWVAILMLFSTYDGRKNIKISDELTSLSFGSCLAIISLAGALFLSYRDTSRFLFISFAILSYLILVGWRLIVNSFLRILNKNITQQHNILIIGAGELGISAYNHLNKLPLKSINVAGFLDKDLSKTIKIGRILGQPHEIESVVKHNNISDVIITLPSEDHHIINELIVRLHNIPIKVWIIPDYFHLALHTAIVDDFAGLPMLDIRAPVLTDYQRMLKRIFDLTMVFLLLPFSLVLGSFITLAIWIDSGVPIIFKQKRVGENGVLFAMYKFRTMSSDAEEKRHLVEYLDENNRIIHKRINDPRVTRVGKFLRKTSLDELPQIINILKGDMSFVGPRPELPYLVEQYESWQRKRFSIPQGITGWWQINGRSEKPMHLHTEDDIYYVQHYSIFLDIYILLKTIIVVIKGQGAF